MGIDTKQVEHIAGLARLSIGEAEKETFRAQLSGILEYIGKLNQLDTSAVEPTSHVLDISNVMREDQPLKSLSPGEALLNAPDGADNFYRVPRIIE